MAKQMMYDGDADDVPDKWERRTDMARNTGRRNTRLDMDDDDDIPEPRSQRRRDDFDEDDEPRRPVKDRGGDGYDADGRSRSRSGLHDRMRAKMQQIDDERGSYYKLKEGDNLIRILPSWRGEDEEFYLETTAHYRIGPNRRTVPCLKQWGDRCPICERIEQMQESTDPDQHNRAHDMRAQTRILMNILTENSPKGVVKVLSVSSNFLGQLVQKYFRLVDQGEGEFTDPQDGYNIFVKREGTGQRSRYPTIDVDRRPSPIAKKDWKANLHNLDQTVKKMTRKEVIAILRGEDTGDE